MAKLISKQVWQQKQLWSGWVKCAQITAPTSLPIIDQLPEPQRSEVRALLPQQQQQQTQQQREDNRIILSLPHSLN